MNRYEVLLPDGTGTWVCGYSAKQAWKLWMGYVRWYAPDRRDELTPVRLVLIPRGRWA